jgi:hypothetical protein
MCHADPAMNWIHSYICHTFPTLPHHTIRQKQKDVSKNRETAYPMLNSIIWLRISLCNGQTVDCLQPWYSTKSNVVSPHPELTDGRPTGNIISVEVCSVTWLRMWRVSHCRKFITSWLGCTQHMSCHGIPCGHDMLMTSSELDTHICAL